MEDRKAAEIRQCWEIHNETYEEWDWTQEYDRVAEEEAMWKDWEDWKIHEERQRTAREGQ